MQEPNVQPVKKIFMGGLPKVSSEEELFSFLSQHAKIFEISIKRKNNDKKGRCKGHGVVTTDAAGYNSLLSLNQFQLTTTLEVISNTIKKLSTREGFSSKICQNLLKRLN